MERRCCRPEHSTIAGSRYLMLHGSDVPLRPDISQIASFSSLAGRKAIFLLALIWIGSPVAGLRPIRAARALTWKMPRLGMRILVPCCRCSTKPCTNASSNASAWRFGRSWLSASPAAICFRLTAAAVAPFTATAVPLGLAGAFALLGAGALSPFAETAGALVVAGFAACANRVLPDFSPVIEAEPHSRCHGRSREIVAPLTAATD